MAIDIPTTDEERGGFIARTLYGEMVSLPQDDPEATAGRIPGIMNEMLPMEYHEDLRLAVRSTSSRAYDALGGLIANAPNPEVAEAYRSAEQGVRMQLKESAEMAIFMQDSQTLEMGWTRWLGKRFGRSLRHRVNLWREGGGIRVLHPSSYEQRVAHRVQQAIDVIASCNSIEDLEAYDAANGTQHAQTVRQQVGLLAPNATAFELEPLVLWAQANETGVRNPLSEAGNNYTFYELVESFVGEEMMISRQVIPILRLIQTNAEYRQVIQDEYNEVHSGDFATKQEEVAFLRILYERAQTIHIDRQRAFEDQKDQKEAYAQAAQIVAKIRREHNEVVGLQERMTELKPPGTTLNRTQELAYQRLSDAHSRSKRNIKTLAQQDYPEATRAIPQPPQPTSGTPENLIDSTDFPHAIPDTVIDANGTVVNEVELTRLWKTATEYQDQASARFQVLQMRWNEDQDAAYATGAGVSVEERDLAERGFYNFADVKDKFNAAKRELAQARSSVGTYSPIQLIQRLVDRRLMDQGVALEDRLKQSTVAALYLTDQVDTDTDETRTVRRAQQAARGRFAGFVNFYETRISKRRITLDGYIEQREKLGEAGIHKYSMPIDIVKAVHQGKISEDELALEMSNLEKFAMDQLEGSGKLALHEEQNQLITYLLTNFKLARYQLKAREILDRTSAVGEGGRGKAVTDMLGQRAAELVIPPPRADEPPVEIQTRRQVEVAAEIADRESRLEEAEEGTWKSDILQQQIKALRAHDSVLLANAMAPVMAAMPRILRRIKNWWDDVPDLARAAT